MILFVLPLVCDLEKPFTLYIRDCWCIGPRCEGTKRTLVASVLPPDESVWVSWLLKRDRLLTDIRPILRGPPSCTCCYFPSPNWPGGVRSIVWVSQKPGDRNLLNFLCAMPMVVAQSSSDGVAIRYVGYSGFVDDVMFLRSGCVVHWCVRCIFARRARNNYLIDSSQILLSDEDQQLHVVVFVRIRGEGAKSAIYDCLVVWETEISLFAKRSKHLERQRPS